MTHRIAPAIGIAMLLGACVSAPVPEGYTGPLARVQDTATPRGGTSVDFFYLSTINGRRINDSLQATRAANYGRGFQMTPQTITRDIPAEPTKATIVGRTHYAAPILALVNKVYEISGEVEFIPVPEQTYVVKGTLGDEYSAVWIEDAAGTMVGHKIEKHGSSTLGFLEK